MADIVGGYLELVEEIASLLPAEGGWWINGRGELVIHTEVSKDPSRSRNGGEYDFYMVFCPMGDRVLSYEDTSCELRIDRCGESGYAAAEYETIIGTEGLRRIAAMTGLIRVCELFLKKQAFFYL